MSKHFIPCPTCGVCGWGPDDDVIVYRTGTKEDARWRCAGHLDAPGTDEYYKVGDVVQYLHAEYVIKKIGKRLVTIQEIHDGKPQGHPRTVSPKNIKKWKPQSAARYRVILKNET